MPKKLTVFLAPMDFPACVNSSTGLGQALVERGHRVVIALGESWRGKLTKQGFEEVYYRHLETEKGADHQERWAARIKRMAAAIKKGPLASYVDLFENEREAMLDDFKHVDGQLRPLLAAAAPDVVVHDSLYSSPAVECYGKPWILVWTAQPLMLYRSTGHVPPAFFGLPIDDRSDWSRLDAVARKVAAPLKQKYSDWLKEQGARPLDSDKACHFVMPSPHGNFFMYPEELDYEEEAGKLKGWNRFDTFVRKEFEAFEVPDQLKTKPGKLIYLSMGSLGCCDLELMRHLVSELATLRHRFIVSKGPFADDFELPDNMWGERHLPQTKVLEAVDLFITHGGNNSVTEALFCGKPMIVLPLFGDQPDNAQRVAEKGFGFRFKPYEVTGKELNEAIEKLLNDKELMERLERVKARVRAANNQVEAAKLIEVIAAKH